ncbi:glycosyltransferase family 39 protein [Devosia sp.]|uniref:glycosyltransferase family 39 protein n=1 Tax=Devosia sp. TaxID=1871048 RepID=UPI003BA8775A
MADQSSPAEPSVLASRHSKLTWGLGLAIVLAVLALKLAIAGTLNLRSDEAYVWTWSHENALSFLDHPPMIAWFARLGTALFGQNLLGVRLPIIVALLISELLLADIVRRRTGSLGVGLAVALMMEASVYFGVTGVSLEPSLPMILFLSLMFWGLCRLEETDDGRWWLLVGLAGGLALLSKYIALLFVPAVLIFVLVPKANRKWVLTAWPWLAVLLAIAAFSPVLIWNAQHDWASFRFQGVRVTEARDFSLGLFASFLTVNLVAIGPILAPLVTVGAILAGWRALRRGDGTVLALAAGFVTILAYLTMRSFTLTINTTWPVAMWPFGIAAMATLLAAPTVGWWRRVAVAGVLTSLLFSIVFDYHLLANPNPISGRNDPVGRDDGYDALAESVRAQAKATGAKWIAASDRRTAAQLRWFLGSEFPVVQLNERSRFMDFAVPDVAGRPGLYVHIKGNREDAVDAEAAGHLTPIGEADRVWRGVSFGTFEIERIESWAPDLNPPPGSSLFVWPDLV